MATLDTPVIVVAPWWVTPGVAAVILLIFAGTLPAVFYMGNDTLQTTMVTTVTNLVIAVGGYYLGSSAGSQKKDDVIAKGMAQVTGGSV